MKGHSLMSVGYEPLQEAASIGYDRVHEDARCGAKDSQGGLARSSAFNSSYRRVPRIIPEHARDLSNGHIGRVSRCTTDDLAEV